ncbi:MAG TPA: 50S ribosomal protein L18 [Sedimentisphaerales bacterium]|nr:50S ribosomal protein L18 [Sedimentisphaerales bacterium]
MEIRRVQKAKRRRTLHVRKKTRGTEDRPRLTVFRSNRNIYAQIVDDTSGATLASAGTLTKALRSGSGKTAGNKAGAAAIGEAIAKQAGRVGIKAVRFDRGPYRYHGRVKALAEAARKAGLAF